MFAPQSDGGAGLGGGGGGDGGVGGAGPLVAKKHTGARPADFG